MEAYILLLLVIMILVEGIPHISLSFFFFCGLRNWWPEKPQFSACLSINTATSYFRYEADAFRCCLISRKTCTSQTDLSDVNDSTTLRAWWISWKGKGNCTGFLWYLLLVPLKDFQQLIFRKDKIKKCVFSVWEINLHQVFSSLLC